MRIICAVALFCLLPSCSGADEEPAPMSKTRPATGTVAKSPPDSGISGELPAELVGSWRSSAENEKEGGDGRDLVMEMELRGDGTYRMRMDLGFGVLDEYEGTWRFEDGKLRRTPHGKPFEWTVVVDGDRMSLGLDGYPKWKHVLVWSDEPHPALQKLPPRPRTVEEAVETLKKIVSKEDQQTIREMEESALADLHFGLGLYIRNAFDLWERESPLLRATGGYDADEASGVILEAFWKSLQEDE